MNLELAKRVRQIIRDNPERHNQSTWFSDNETLPNDPSCGTTACLAGWVAALDGYTLKEMDRRGWDVPDYSAEALEIDRGVAEVLFHTMNDEAALHLFDKLIEADGAMSATEVRDLQSEWYDENGYRD